MIAKLQTKIKCPTSSILKFSCGTGISNFKEQGEKIYCDSIRIHLLQFSISATYVKTINSRTMFFTKHVVGEFF